MNKAGPKIDAERGYDTPLYLKTTPAKAYNNIIRAIRRKNNAIPAQSNNNAIEKQDEAAATPGEGDLVPFHLGGKIIKRKRKRKSTKRKGTKRNSAKRNSAKRVTLRGSLRRRR
jgi:hypothetical protein